MKARELQPASEADLDFAEHEICLAMKELQEIVKRDPVKVRREIPKAYFRLCKAVEMKAVAEAELSIIYEIENQETPC